MTYKAIIIFDNNGVKELILVPENAVNSVTKALSEKLSGRDDLDFDCVDTIVCKSVKDLENKSVLFKG